VWSYDTGQDVGHPLVVSKNRVFAASNNHILYCFKTKKGTKVWEFDTGGEVVTGAVLDGKGRVFIGSSSSMLHVIHEANGTLIWSFNNSSPLMGEIIVRNDNIYMTTADNILHALRTSDGSHVWSYENGTNKNVCICHLNIFVFCCLSTVLI
jgi:outer membrane protein assembly factor BamB